MYLPICIYFYQFEDEYVSVYKCTHTYPLVSMSVFTCLYIHVIMCAYLSVCMERNFVEDSQQLKNANKNEKSFPASVASLVFKLFFQLSLTFLFFSSSTPRHFLFFHLNHLAFISNLLLSRTANIFHTLFLYHLLQLYNEFQKTLFL